MVQTKTSGHTPAQKQLVQDTEICDLLNVRNPKGMRLLFDAYYKSLVTWANTFIGDLGKAEDVVQEFFIALWDGDINRQLQPETLGAFLRVLVRNRAHNYVSRRDVLNRCVDLDGIDTIFQEYDDTKDLLAARVFREIERLPARSREILTGVFVEGLKYHEVAERLGISVSTVKTLLGNAVRKLREHLDGDSHPLFLFLYYRRRNN